MTHQERARELRPLIEKAAESLGDEDALNGIELFPKWSAEEDYALDVRVQYDGVLYRCIQAHTAQDNWTPGATPALWVEVAPPGEIPVWKQPLGSEDAYMTGDRVWYPEKGDAVYESLVAYNAWSPETYGWQIVE